MDDIAELEAAATAEQLDSGEAGGRFIRGSVSVLGTYGAGILLSLVSVPLVTRHLGPVGYGYFGTVSAMVFIIGGFTEGGLNTLAIREYTNGSPEHRTALMRNLTAMRVIATAVAVVAVATVLAASNAASQISLGVLLAGAGLCVTIIGDTLAIPLLVGMRITTASLVGLLRQAVLAASYVALVLIGSQVLPFLGATMLSGGVALAALVIILRGRVSLRPAFDLAMWRELLVRTLPYAAATAVGVVYFREALVLIEFLSTTRQAGYYAAAFRIVEVLASLPWLIISTSFPIFARAARDDLGRLRYALQRLFEVSLLLGAWMSVCVLLGARLGILVVAGRKFLPAVGVLQIQGLAVITSFLVATFGFSLLSLQLYRSLLWSNAAAVAVATVVSVALIPSHGAHGAAVAPTAAEAVLAVAYAISLARYDRTLRLSLGIVPKVAVASGVAIGVAYAASSSGVIRLLVATALYFAVALLLRAVPFELWNAVLRREPEPLPDQPPADESLSAGEEH